MDFSEFAFEHLLIILKNFHDPIAELVMVKVLVDGVLLVFFGRRLCERLVFSSDHERHVFYRNTLDFRGNRQFISTFEPDRRA